MYITVAYISWSTYCALYLKNYLMDKYHISDNECDTNFDPKINIGLYDLYFAEHPLREKTRRKIKITYNAEGFLRETSRRNSRRNSARCCGDTPRNVVETLREISRWVGKDLGFLHADSEDSDQTEKMSKYPA